MNCVSVSVQPFEKDAKRFASVAHERLVGSRFRFEPTPNQLTNSLEEGHMRGELSAAERILAAIENDRELNREEILGELHLFIMGVNNRINEKFGLGKKIDGVEFFTQKYLTEQSLNFVQ